MNKTGKLSFYIILIFLSFFLLSCKEKNNCLYLDNFEYSISGRNGPFFSIEDNLTLQKLNKIVPDHEGFIWIRTYFELPSDLENEHLGIYLGIVKIAEECYINHDYIGKSGKMPPYEYSTGEVPTYFSIPPSTLNYNGDQNLLEIKVWVNCQGRMDSSPFIGKIDDVYNKYLLVDFRDSKFSLIASYIMIVVAFIYLVLYLFRRKEKANLSFSRLNFCSSLYMLTMCIGEYTHFSSFKYFSYLLYLKLFTGMLSVITTYFAVSFIRDFFGVTDSIKRKIYRISITLIPCILFIFPKELKTFFDCLIIGYILIAFQLFYAIRILFIQFKHRNKQIITLLIGFSPVLLSFVVEFIFILFGYPFIKLIIVIGWQLTILSFFSILVVNFAKTSNEVEFLNNNLEKIVMDRTSELQETNNLLEETNSHLEFEKQRAEKEISLAAFVQQSFYKNNLPRFSEWDINFYFKPLAGVSGDMYDFYINNQQLKGFGIFDVSGHGIASGLVTMLVKNIIHQEFFAGQDFPLPDIMDIINNRIIEEKGNIENYLTGILARIKDSNNIEFVNGGHPTPILYTKIENKAQLLIDENSKKCGVIGIPDFPTIFETQNISLSSGDSLLLYTDGITEAQNKDGEEYGTNRLLATFESTQRLTIANQIHSIINDVESFINSDKINDDITILIIRKR